MGIWNTFFGLAAFTVGIHVFGDDHYTGAFCLASVISVLQAYVAQKCLVWKTTSNATRELARFVLVYGLSTGLNYALLKGAIEIGNFPPVQSQVLITGLIVALTYLLNKGWTFKNRPEN